MLMDASLQAVFERVAARRDLSRDEARALFERIMLGEVGELPLAAFLGAMRTKGVVVDEIVGAAEAMRAHSIKVRCAADCIDTCGTGGDGISTFNVSTTAAIIAAAAGAVVAKHGNRSASRVSGSTEVLTELGIDVEAAPAVVERCLGEVGIGYLNARQLHPAMKHAAPVRAALKVRTIFNLLGPLTNPAGARRQVVGVPKPELLDLIASALTDLGAVHVWVVHGDDGLCDLTATAPTTIVEVRSGETRRFRITPEEVGLSRVEPDSLLVGSSSESARRVLSVLRGEPGPCRDHAMLNAGAALVVAGRAESLLDGVGLASEAVDSGRAISVLERWRGLAGTGA